MKQVGVQELMRFLRPGGRLLGLDVGTKHVGVAISSDSYRRASPLNVMDRERRRSMAKRLRGLVERAGVVGLVVGLPPDLSGHAGFMAVKIRRFLDELAAHEQLGWLPYTYWDERYSSAAAEAMLQSMDLSPHQWKRHMDMFSAIFILQGCLDEVARLSGGAQPASAAAAAAREEPWAAAQEAWSAGPATWHHRASLQPMEPGRDVSPALRAGRRAGPQVSGPDSS